MKYFTLFFIAFFSFGVVQAQVYNDTTLKLSEEGRAILEHPEYKERKAANKSFTATLIAYLRTAEGFEDPLTGVNNMLRLPLGEEALIITWQMPDSTFEYKRFGLVAAKWKDTIVVSYLEEQPDVPNMQFKVLRPAKWYGAIYYAAIPERKKKAKFYTLLGYAPGKDLNEKIIDVIEIDKNGRPIFGAKIFRVEEFMDKTLPQAPMRLILKYGGDYSASVRWLEEEELIVMDHLAPPDAKLKGVYRVYGPDMSYDALRWDKKWWHLDKEVNFNTGQKIQIREPDKPLGLPVPK